MAKASKKTKEKQPVDPERDIYRIFPDGWDFTPAVGNASSRGEVFTPLWVVEKMIIDSGMLPEAAVKQGDYSAPREKALHYVTAKINEPAVGTANFTATILHHKLRFASQLARGASTKELLSTKKQLTTYSQLLLSAVASLYAYDIDCGNLETTRRRLLNQADPKPLNDPSAQTYWGEYLQKELSRSKKLSAVEKRGIARQVESSLAAAQTHWWRFVESGRGVIDQAYREATGKELPPELREQCEEILGENIKLFNGIQEKATFSPEKDFYCPGWDHVVWQWWSFELRGEEVVASKRPVKMATMIKEAELEQLKAQPSTKQTEKKKRELELELLNLGEKPRGTLF